MSTYLFNNKRDHETNKLMGVVIFLILSLVFTIVISISVFLVYFDDYMSIQKQYTLLEEKFQKISVENYEKSTHYNRLNVELNQVKNEVNKLTLEKELSDKNVKLVEYFIDAVNIGNQREANKFINPAKVSTFSINKGYKFPNDIVAGDFVLNDDLKTGTVTYFHTKDGERTDKYVFDLSLKDNKWYINGMELFENNSELEPLLY